MFRQTTRKRIDIYHHDIPTKANRILNLILIAFILILIRIWHLAVVQYDQKVEEAKKPQQKVVIEPATRATIRDRFNIPLALNKIQYQATILYSQIKEIPSIVWEKDENTGKKIRKFKRKEYIHQLALLLAHELGLEAERIEDLIHAKASYYFQVPYVIKYDLTEIEYYRLKMLEKSWPGIYARSQPKRVYPRGRVASDIVGYLGAINRQEYEKILHEMHELEEIIFKNEEEDHELPVGIDSLEQARKRLKDLKEKAYTINDYIGKTGVEGFYEKQLRGFYGKKSFYSDSRGNFLRELPGSRPAISGQRLLLTISAELQEYAEQLLAQNETIRIVRITPLGEIKKTILALKHPWIKGGAIVVMDPQSGDILTLASHPRFNPNDFIASGNTEKDKEKKAHIVRWFENEAYLADLWNQQQPLERERYDNNKFYDEKKVLTWDAYLDFILPQNNPLKKILHSKFTINEAIKIQKSVEQILKLTPESNLYSIFNVLYSNEHVPYPIKLKTNEKCAVEMHLQPHLEEIKQIKITLDPYFKNLPQNYDKVLLVDLCRLSVCHESFSSELLKQIGNTSLITYKNSTGNLVALLGALKKISKDLYHRFDFVAWRNQNEKEFLKMKRLEEKKAKTYAKPYIDYLDQQENICFASFWDRYKWDLLLTLLLGTPNQKETLLQPYIDYLTKLHSELDFKENSFLTWKKNHSDLKKSIENLNPSETIEYFKSMRSYEDLNRPLFGLYKGLRQRKNPLEKHLAAAFYPVYGFSYGRSQAYRNSTIQGSIFKLITAYAALIQNYKKIGKENITFNELNPLSMVDQVYTQDSINYVGYTQEGKPIPQNYKGGRIPRSLAHLNNGRVDLIKALEVSSNPYFSLLASECLEKPEDLANAAHLFSYGEKTGIDLPGEITGKVPDDLATNRTGLYAMAIGQHSLVVTPLQTAVMLSSLANGGKILKPKIVKMQTSQLPHRNHDFSQFSSEFPYQESPSFPLFVAGEKHQQKKNSERVSTTIKRTIFLPAIIRNMLLKGLRAVANRTHQEATISLTRLYQSHPEAIQAFTEMKNQLIGKTSTSESVETIDLDLEEGTNIYTHVWFGSISFQKDTSKKANAFIFKDEFGQPELVVVVYLRYGGYGKEAAPLAAQMVKKWQEIKQKYSLH